MNATFRLAPMSAGLRVLTWIVLTLPAISLYAALKAPPPVNAMLLGATMFIAAIYASVWLVWRPTRFEVDATTLRIVWPLRVRAIDRTKILRARFITATECRRDYGRGMRIGAGGLWGGFGLLKTKAETFSMWISRTDSFVIVVLRDARSLLLTPEEPERFVTTITRS